MSPTPQNPPADKAPTSFPAFPRLPADMRQEIWRSASATPGTTPGVCILTLAIPLGASQRAQHAPLVVHEPRNPSLLQTSTEAYDMTVSSPPPGPRPFNPAIDTLYLGPSEFIYFTDHLTRRDPDDVPWFSEIRHIALSLVVADRGMALPMAIMSLPRLSALSVVYPGAVGTWDFETDMPPPEDEEDGKMLRVLTDEEAEGCFVEADYIYETHGGDQHIAWRRNAREHIGFVEEKLVDYMARVLRMETDEKRVPPTWDKRSRRLKLEYHAVVWDEGMERLDFDGSEDGGEIDATETWA